MELKVLKMQRRTSQTPSVCQNMMAQWQKGEKFPSLWKKEVGSVVQDSFYPSNAKLYIMNQILRR